MNGRAKLARIGSKVVKHYHLPEVVKHYHLPKTPYQRLLGSTDVPRQAMQQLKRTYQELNPAQLIREIARLQQELWKAVQKKNKKQRVA